MSSITTIRTGNKPVPTCGWCQFKLTTLKFQQRILRKQQVQMSFGGTHTKHLAIRFLQKSQKKIHFHLPFAPWIFHFRIYKTTD